MTTLKPFPKLVKKTPLVVPEPPPPEPQKKKTPGKKKKVANTNGIVLVPVEDTTAKKGTDMTNINYQAYVLDQFKLLFEGNNIPFDDRISDLTKQVERAIYEFVRGQAKNFNIDTPTSLNSENVTYIDTIHTRFIDLYLSKVRSILINLNPKSYLNYVGQDKILQQFLSGELTPEKLVNAKPYELAPDRWKSMIDQRIHEAQISSKGFTISTTDLFKCGKCKQRKCSYYQMQTRSQDEPMTTFITCVNCGNKWRE